MYLSPACSGDTKVEFLLNCVFEKILVICCLGHKLYWTSYVIKFIDDKANMVG